MVDVKDVAKTHLLAAEHDRKDEGYIPGNENSALGELLRRIEEITVLAIPKC